MDEIVEVLNTIVASGAMVTVVIVYFAIEAIKTSSLVNNKYLPIVAMVTGLIVGVLIALFSGSALVEGGTLGILAGGFASGLYKAIYPNSQK